ncbi:MAG: flagellar biosynthesis protein FlgJ [bacterium]|nr:flagellar biosynthesis protein FlgJ [bacterium]
MDVTVVPITLHPKAESFLFEHYVTVNRVFSNVLGQLETEYLAIALINANGQMFFFSSKPSIQQNLIEQDLWSFYGSYQADFINQEHPKLWSELNHGIHADLIKKFMHAHGLSTGIAIPTEYNHYKAIFSFGFKQVNPFTQNKTPLHCKQLLTLGKYCLREFKERLLFPDEQKNTVSKPHLQLIINNEVVYE